MTQLDIRGNRAASKYSPTELLMRVVWGCVRPAFGLSPRIAHRWRVILLRMLGARIGGGVQIHPSVTIFAPWSLNVGDESSIGEGVRLYNLGPIRIGRQVTVSQGAHLCAGSHDYQKSDLPLRRLPIVIQDMVWVCADAFVGPGVTVGEGAVVGARAVVVRDVPAWVVVAGNPARELKKRELEGRDA